MRTSFDIVAGLRPAPDPVAAVAAAARLAFAALTP